MWMEGTANRGEKVSGKSRSLLQVAEYKSTIKGREGGEECVDFPEQQGEDRGENKHVPRSPVKAAQCGSSCSQLLACPAPAWLS